VDSRGLGGVSWLSRDVERSTPSTVRFSSLTAAMLWFCFAHSTDAHADDACADARRLAAEQHERASKSWDPPVQEEAVFVFSQLIETCAESVDRLQIIFWRAFAYMKLKRPIDAATDFDLVANSTSTLQCGATYNAINLWFCVDDLHRRGGDPFQCVMKPRDPNDRLFFLGALPPWQMVSGLGRMPLLHQARRILALAYLFERRCQSWHNPDGTSARERALWQRARVYGRYGRREDVERALCTLALSYPGSLPGTEAAFFLAKLKATCADDCRTKKRARLTCSAPR
jgi:hypothetical protein